MPRHALVLLLVFACRPALEPSASVPPSPELLVLDSGTPPRRVLRYPTAARERTIVVEFREWSHHSDSHRRACPPLCDSLGTATVLAGTCRFDGQGGVEVELDRRLDAGPVISSTESVRVALPYKLDYAISSATFGVAVRSDARAYDGLAPILPRRLPAAPLGRGARWRARDDVVWEVVKLDGDRVELRGEAAALQAAGDTMSRQSTLAISVVIDSAAGNIKGMAASSSANHVNYGWRSAASWASTTITTSIE